MIDNAIHHLPDGVTVLQPGKIAAAVTFLEMRQPPKTSVEKPFEELRLRRVGNPDPGWYRTIFRLIGENWLWFSRLLLDDAALTAIVHDPAVEVFTLDLGGPDKGFLELDCRAFPEIEVAFFGLVPELFGRGVGAWLMSEALRAAWGHKPDRVVIHTCTLDHPVALRFYLRCGFVPYQRGIEIADDPRISGVLPRTAAPHVPIIE